MYWITADMYFKANQMGILDPETYTQKNEDYSQKISEGQVFFSSMEWDFDAGNAELNKTEVPTNMWTFPGRIRQNSLPGFPEPPNLVWQPGHLLFLPNAMKQN